MKYYKIITLLITVLLLNSCNENPPVVQDGNGVLKIIAMGDTSLVSSVTAYAPLRNAKVILTSEYGTTIKYTDEKGVLTLSGIPSSTYGISVRCNHPSLKNVLLVGNLNDQIVTSGSVVVDTIKATQISNTGICINEIYVCGPVNSVYFFYDEFFELYNYSDEVKYLDGMMFMRMTGDMDLGINAGEDAGNDGDIDVVGYVFKFPGKPGEKNYPFYPKTFKVLATTAYNHSKTVSTAVDLSNADWEFYNQYSASDFDNPKVPNLINMRSDKTVDFMCNLVSDIVLLASGVDSDWTDGIDVSTIIDAVDYKSSTTATKYSDPRIDKSFAISPARYSGKSMQRREPGGDTNDSRLDFEIKNVPTPGRQ